MDKKLKQVEEMAKDLINYYCPVYKFQWDGAVKRYGYCSYEHKTVSISKPLATLNPVDVTLNTVLHEIAHALSPKSAHHGREWKSVARSIGNDGLRCYGAIVARPQAKYVGTCPNCDKIIFRHRRKRIACAKCCAGVFNEEYLFIWNE